MELLDPEAQLVLKDLLVILEFKDHRVFKVVRVTRGPRELPGQLVRSVLKDRLVHRAFREFRGPPVRLDQLGQLDLLVLPARLDLKDLQELPELQGLLGLHRALPGLQVLKAPLVLLELHKALPESQE